MTCRRFEAQSCIVRALDGARVLRRQCVRPGVRFAAGGAAGPPQRACAILRITTRTADTCNSVVCWRYVVRIIGAGQHAVAEHSELNGRTAAIHCS